MGNKFNKTLAIKRTPPVCHPPPPAPQFGGPQGDCNLTIPFTCPAGSSNVITESAIGATNPGTHNVGVSGSGGGAFNLPSPIVDDGVSHDGTWTAPALPGTYTLVAAFVWPGGFTCYSGGQVEVT